MSLFGPVPTALVIQSVTRSAVPSPSVYLGIFGRVLMALRAVRLGRVSVSAVVQRVSLIFRARPVLKVDQPVVQCVAVQVTDVLTPPGRAQKSHQDQLMDITGASATRPVIERDALISVPIQDRFQDPAIGALKTHHAAVIADRVLRVPLNREPSFHGYECTACTPVTGGPHAC